MPPSSNHQLQGCTCFQLDSQGGVQEYPRQLFAWETLPSHSATVLEVLGPVFFGCTSRTCTTPGTDVIVLTRSIEPLLELVQCFFPLPNVHQSPLHTGPPVCHYAKPWGLLVCQANLVPHRGENGNTGFR